jgi:hypothetical protein
LEFRKVLPVPISSKVFSMFSSNGFKVSGLTFRSLILNGITSYILSFI